MNYPFKQKDWLIEQINKYGYVSAICKNTGYSKTSIRRYIEKYELKSLLRKPLKEELKQEPNYGKHPYKNKEWLQEQIYKYKNVPEICKNTGCTKTQQ